MIENQETIHTEEWFFFQTVNLNKFMGLFLIEEDVWDATSITAIVLYDPDKEGGQFTTTIYLKNSEREVNYYHDDKKDHMKICKDWIGAVARQPEFPQHDPYKL